jgi:DNA-directed RNA polymerase specialized sigma24 family protein
LVPEFHAESDVIRAIIRDKARSLVGHAGLARQDRDDLQQELFLRLWRRGSRYEAGRGTVSAFVAAVVDREGAPLLRDRRALKRGLGRTVSLNHTSVETEGLVFAVWDDGPDHAARTMDVNAILASLPADLRAVAESLKSGSKSQVARDRGKTPSTLQRTVEAIRRAFLDAGYDPFP